MRGVALLLLVWLPTLSSQPTNHDAACAPIVEDFLAKRAHPLRFPPDSSPFTAKFVFFLHVPRTAGRSFLHCFLLKPFVGTHRCAASYSAFRLEVSQPGCQVISSHDDYSVTDFLPAGASIVTQIRPPEDRFLSAYEFGVDVASRSFRRSPPKRKVKTQGQVNTKDVWPWEYLVPYFQRNMEKSAREIEQIQLRKGKQSRKPTWLPAISKDTGRRYYFNRETKQSKWVLSPEEKSDSLPLLNPHNNSLFIPLHKFVATREAELLHNGMTFQILGITNNSYWPEAEQVRRCMMVSKSAENKLMELARRRIDSMVHISLTSELKESVQSLAAKLGFALNAPIWNVPKIKIHALESNLTNLMDRLEELDGNFLSASDQEITDLAIKAHGRMAKHRELYRNYNYTTSTPQELRTLHKQSEQSKRIYRHIQTEALLRRKRSNNIALTDIPPLEPYELQPQSDWCD